MHRTVSNSPKVFAKRASSTCTLCHQIMFSWLHFRREAISTDYLMRMRTSDESGVDKRIQTFDRELRAREAHHGCAARDVLGLRGASKDERMEGRNLHDACRSFEMDDGDEMVVAGTSLLSVDVYGD